MKNAIRYSKVVLAAVLCLAIVWPLGATASDEETSSPVPAPESTQKAQVAPDARSSDTTPSPTDETHDTSASKGGRSKGVPSDEEKGAPSSLHKQASGMQTQDAVIADFSDGVLSIQNHVTGSLATEIVEAHNLVPFSDSDVNKIVIAGEALDSDDFSSIRTISTPQFKAVDISQTSTEVVADSAFMYWLNLEEVDLPTTVSTIEDFAFSETVNLKTLSGIDNVLTIGESSFMHSGLPEVNFPKLETVGPRAFWEAYLVKGDFPSVTTVADRGFQLCYDLKSINLPKATSLGISAFDKSNSLLYIDLPEVTTIGRAGFFESGLTAIRAPKLKDLSYETFGGCANLRFVVFGDMPTWVPFMGFPPDQPLDETFSSVPADAVLFYTGEGDSSAIGWKSNSGGASVDRPTIRYDVQPEPLFRDLGYTAPFSLGITATNLPADLSFGWEHDGATVPDETQSKISIYPVHVPSGGEYLGYASFPYTDIDGDQVGRVDFIPTTLTVGPLTLDPPGPFRIKVGETAFTVPSYAPVDVDPLSLWTYDKTLLSATVTYEPPKEEGVPATSSITFKGLKPGTTTVTYAAGGATVSAQITVWDDGIIVPNPTPKPTPAPAPISHITNPASTSPSTGDTDTPWYPAALLMAAALGMVVSGLSFRKTRHSGNSVS